ncbi:MAG TPA: hypothetical protein VMZ66_03690 [Aeromicrobium sp.]|nr:hypothetical protein [Aeromicrobium sp.]
MDNPTTTPPAHLPHHISDEHLGAVEGDRATDPQGGNPNAALVSDEDQSPEDEVAVAEDVLGANIDETQG